MSESLRHPDDDRLQALAAGTLDAADEAVVRSHVAGCERCGEELETWHSLLATLGGLPAFEPRGDFADRVMARVDVRPRWAFALAAVLARPMPRTTAGWALIAAILAVPALVYGGAVAWLTSQPWFSTGWMLAFAQEAVAGAYMFGRDLLVSWLTGSAVAEWVARLVTSTEPGAIGAAAALFGTAVVVSAWVLYRNLIRTPRRERGHATFAF